jgi:hypothetical protein
VVSCHKPGKDGRTVRQLLIDSYASQEQEQPAEKERREDEDPRELERMVQDLRKGKKYTTPFWLQLWILAQRTFKQRRAEILCWRQVVLVVALAVLSGLLWLRLGKDGALLPLPPELYSSRPSSAEAGCANTTENQIGDRNGFLFFRYGPFLCLSQLT